MKQHKIVAWLLILIIIGLTLFSTVQLFLGNLPAAMSTFPIVLFLYFLVMAQQKRK